MPWGSIMNPDTMTVADCIAWLARDDGWTQDDLGWWNHPTRKKLEVGQYFFPYVADLKFAQMHISNDFSIRILIEKNKVSVSAVLASNMGHADDIILNAIAEDELTARYRLAVKCRLALKNRSE